VVGFEPVHLRDGLRLDLDLEAVSQAAATVARSAPYVTFYPVCRARLGQQYL
jgi:hypothetical protein